MSSYLFALHVKAWGYIPPKERCYDKDDTLTILYVPVNMHYVAYYIVDPAS